MVVVGEIVAIVTILFGFSSMMCIMKSNCCQKNINNNSKVSDDNIEGDDIAEDNNKLKRIIGSLRRLLKR